MTIDLTPYLWLNWLLVALLAGGGWTLGAAIVSALLGLLARRGG